MCTYIITKKIFFNYLRWISLGAEARLWQVKDDSEKKMEKLAADISFKKPASEGDEKNRIT